MNTSSLRYNSDSAFCFLATLSAAWLACAPLFGADYYVSTNGLHEVDGVTWGTYVTDDNVAHDAYTNLQQAITAKFGYGHTFWVEDGFVCDSGGETTSGTGSRISTAYLDGVDKLIIRSRSGKWETGAEIRGAYNSAEEPCGLNSVRCLSINGGVKFIGFRFTGGSTTGNGGGIVAGTYGGTFENCLIENCVAKGNGGGTFMNGSRNYTDRLSMRMVNCVIRNNRTIDGSGGGAYGVHLISCQVYGNAANGTGWSAGNGGGFAYATSVSSYVVIVSNSVFYANSASNPNNVNHASRQAGAGGGIYFSGPLGRIYNCIVSNNTATAWGGGAYSSASVETYNSLFTGNTSTGQNGGGIYGGTHFGALVARNTAKSAGGVFASYSGGNHARLINCTVTDNTIAGTGAPYEAGYAALTNTVVWSENAGEIAVVNNTKGCAYSCYPTAAEGADGNTAKNPKLQTFAGKEYAATSRYCKGKGCEFHWMTDKADIRSKDWYGDRRVFSMKPDMGWVSLKKTGMIFMSR